ncbi:MAG: hypothetical protein L0Z54_02050 [Thermoplasmata archaeon]|nr:hypothetical protein [Thermoplasmata archaeon]
MGLPIVYLVATCMLLHAGGVSYVLVLDHKDTTGELSYRMAMRRYALLMSLFITAGAMFILLFSR